MRICVTNAPGTTFNHIFDKTTTVIACRDQKYETPVLKVNGALWKTVGPLWELVLGCAVIGQSTL